MCMYSRNFKTYRLKEFSNPCCLRASGGGVINHITASLGSYVNGIDERGGRGGREKNGGMKEGEKDYCRKKKEESGKWSKVEKKKREN